MKLACLMAVAAAVAGLPALAEPVGGKAADDMLFGVRGSSVAVAQDLSEVEQVILRKVIELSETQMNQPLRYYASIAFSPDDGLTQEPGPISSANHHGVAAADAAALAACDAKRRAGTRPCRIGARVVPRGYAPQPLELSLGATTAYRETYRKARGEKALAISAASGQFAVATGAGAAATAVAQCNATSGGANDCVVAIAD